MSNSSLPERRTALPSIYHGSILERLCYRAKGLAFWSAIALPFLHIPLLVTGLESSTTLIAFAALVLVNVLTLYLGQSYALD